MINLSLKELYSLYDNFSKEGSNSELDPIKEIILMKENEVGSIGVGMSDASTAGMGGVHQSQPSSIPGALNGSNWMMNGGQEGSGDISIPYNPSGANRSFHTMKSPMGKNHGPKTGKKTRVKKLDLKGLKTMMLDRSKKSKGAGRVMNFDDFAKKDITTRVTKVKE